MAQYQSFLSNCLELLFDRLTENLFEQNKPFVKRLIVVPSQSMKSWLTLRLADSSKFGISMGLEVSYLDQAITKINRYLLPKFKDESYQLSELELAFVIENEIRSLIGQQPNFIDDETELWKPLFNYTKAILGTQNQNKKTDRRIEYLSSKLASLFINYGTYGGQEIKEWETKKNLDWQKALWCRIYQKHEDDRFKYTYPFRKHETLINELNQIKDLKSVQEVQLFIFGLSFISQLQENYLKELSNHIPIKCFFLSPCQLFWSDITSDKESFGQLAYWSEKNAHKNQLETLEELLKDRNPLLANFGRLGRNLAELVENQHLPPSEDYAISQSTLEHEAYSDLINDEVNFYEDDESLSLLHALQADITLLRTPKFNSKINIEDTDHTVQVHKATSKLREVQVIYDIILNIMGSDPQICSHDILVMSPNIASYVPFIRAVFEAEDSQLNAKIMDLPKPLLSSLIDGYIKLIALSESRWDALSLIQLFECQEFQNRHKFSKDNINSIKNWIKASKVNWGESDSHRDELLKERYCLKGMVEKNELGTWSNAFDRLLLGLSISPEIMEEEDYQLGLEEIDSQNAVLLGQWIQLMKSLKLDLQPLKIGTKKNLKEWSEYLKFLLNKYFLPENNLKDEFQVLLETINQLSNAHWQVPEGKYSFISIKNKILDSLKRHTSTYHENIINSVRFCSLLPMRTIPSKVIILIGMDDLSFPKYDNNFSLNLLKGSTLSDYCPSKIDYDRYIFLEAILAARQYLVFTYSSKGSDNDQSNPSILISELLSYLDKTYLVNNEIASQTILREHPFNAFDKSYFSVNASFKSTSLSSYKAALSLYNQAKESPHFIIKNFTSTASSNTFSKKTIDLKELDSFARNPVKTYFNKTLGIYLKPNEERIIKEEESFHINALQKHILHKMSFKTSLDEIISHGIGEGYIPIGPFKPVIIDMLKSEIDKIDENIIGLGLSKNVFFEIEVAEQHNTVTQISERKWGVPPVQIEVGGESINLLGTIKEATPLGLILNVKDEKKDAVKIWPQYLFFTHVIKQYNLPFQANGLFIKGSKGKIKKPWFDCSINSMQCYLNYYLIGLKNVSPLIPEWVPTILEKDSHSLKEKMIDSLNDPFEGFFNHYVKWMLHTNNIPNCEEIITSWHDLAESLYSDLYKNWYPPKGES